MKGKRGKKYIILPACANMGMVIKTWSQKVQWRTYPSRIWSTFTNLIASSAPLTNRDCIIVLLERPYGALHSPTQHNVGLYWVSRHDGPWGNEIANKLERGSSIQKFIGPELSQGVSRQNIKNKIKRRVRNQHSVKWCGAPELISGPSLATKAQLLSFDTTQSRVITGILTGHNTPRRHLYVMGLSNNPNCRKCGSEEETSDHILCECEALASLRHAYLGSFFLDPEDIINVSIVAIWSTTDHLRRLRWSGG
jgi:hypothetical protein